MRMAPGDRRQCRGSESEPADDRLDQPCRIVDRSPTSSSRRRRVATDVRSTSRLLQAASPSLSAWHIHCAIYLAQGKATKGKKRGRHGNAAENRCQPNIRGARPSLKKPVEIRFKARSLGKSTGDSSLPEPGIAFHQVRTAWIAPLAATTASQR